MSFRVVFFAIFALISSQPIAQEECDSTSMLQTRPYCDDRDKLSEENANLKKQLADVLNKADGTQRQNIFFRSQPDKFVYDLFECMQSSGNCSIIYQHIGKTGGKGVEKLMFDILGSEKAACCDEDMMARFHASPGEYCPNPFQSYEVPVENFAEIVHTCQSWVGEEHRAIVLTTFREPFTRTLSVVHQLCNKNFETREKDAQEACLACDYDRDTEFWNNTLNRTYDVYWRLQRQAVTEFKDQHHLWLDTADLNNMFMMLAARFSDNTTRQAAFQSYFQEPHNPETLDVCNFRLTSKALKVIQPSVAFYQKFTDESFL